MASYIHECVSCGAELTVHERYFGRTLRCTGCGTTFEASPPVEPESERAATPIADPDDRIVVPLRAVAGAVVVVVLVGVFLWWLSTGPIPPPIETGRIAVVGGQDECPAALDSASAAALGRSLRDGAPAANDKAAAVSSLRPGTRIQVLQDPDRHGMVAVRVLTGPWASRKVWVPARRLDAVPVSRPPE